MRARAHAPQTCHQPSHDASSRPHIVQIVADDLGYHDVGYHNPQMLTPNLDGLRACGVELDSFYSFKTCGPSRASILTGRYPFSLGVYSNEDISNGVPTNFTLLPEILKAGGYVRTPSNRTWKHAHHSPIGILTRGSCRPRRRRMLWASGTSDTE